MRHEFLGEQCPLDGWKTLLVTLALAAFGSCPAAHAQDRQIDIASPAVGNEWLAAMLRQVVSSDGPGCSAAVKQDGLAVASRSAGYANLENRVPITAATRFNIGSVAKQFTAAAILILIQEGRLARNDDVRRYLPELPDYGTPITVDQLLTHTAGIRDAYILNYVGGWYPFDRRHFSQAETVRTIARQRSLNFAPGTNWSYSNSGYILAAEIVRRVSGQTLRQFLRSRVFEPLGMSSTDVADDYREPLPDAAHSYSQEGDRLVHIALSDIPGPGGVYSTVSDMLVWDDAIANDRLGALVSQELGREAETIGGVRVGYTRGRMPGRYRGRAEIGHGGATGGATAMLVRYPELNLSIAAACNAGELSAVRLSRRIADHFLDGIGSGTTAQTQPPATTAAQSDDLIGVYLAADGYRADFTLTDGRLLWNGSPLTTLSPGRFRVGRSIEIRVIDKLRVDVVSIETGFLRRYNKIEKARISNDALAALTGLYVSDEANAQYRVELHNGGLRARIVNGPDFALILTPVGADYFETQDRDLIRFERGTGGLPTAFLFINERLNGIRFDRVPERVTGSNRNSSQQ